MCVHDVAHAKNATLVAPKTIWSSKLVTVQSRSKKAVRTQHRFGITKRLRTAKCLCFVFSTECRAELLPRCLID